MPRSKALKSIGKAASKLAGKASKKSTGGVKVGIKNAENAHVKTGQATGPPPKVIRMTMSLSGPAGVFQKGKSYNVPEQCPVVTARNWVRSGAAVEVDG